MRRHGLWNDPSVPKDGWICTYVTDLGAPKHTCGMCGQEKVRYVHSVTHADYRDLDVGCVCVEDLTGDKVGPKWYEKFLRNRDKRRKAWPDRKWAKNLAGHEYLPHKKGWVSVRPSGQSLHWHYWINSGRSELTYFGPRAAKLALFDNLHRRRVKVRSRNP